MEKKHRLMIVQKVIISCNKSFSLYYYKLKAQFIFFKYNNINSG